jgi:hypothetical protein
MQGCHFDGTTEFSEVIETMKNHAFAIDVWSDLDDVFYALLGKFLMHIVADMCDG